MNISSELILYLQYLILHVDSTHLPINYDQYNAIPSLLRNAITQVHTDITAQLQY